MNKERWNSNEIEMKQEKSTKSVKTNTHNFLVHRFSSICHINRYNRYRSKISIILIDIGYLSYRLYSIPRNFPFSQSCVFSPRGHYKNVLWSVDKNVENTDKTWLDVLLRWPYQTWGWLTHPESLTTSRVSRISVSHVLRIAGKSCFQYEQESCETVDLRRALLF